jgi:sugar phosphate isomerase/epimerase
MEAAGLSTSVARVRAAGLRVSSLIGVGPYRLDREEQWPGVFDALLPVIDAAAQLGAGCLVLTPGGAGSLRWEEAASRFTDLYGPVADAARARGVPFAIENTGWLRFENGFTTTLRDTVDLADTVGAGVCVEVNNCWMERDLTGVFARAADRFLVFQLSDYVEGTGRTPARAVPGDGMIPLRRIVTDVIAAGYRGPFEVEILGPAIDAEGVPAAVGRALTWCSSLLDELDPQVPPK